MARVTMGMLDEAETAAAHARLELQKAQERIKVLEWEVQMLRNRQEGLLYALQLMRLEVQKAQRRVSVKEYVALAD